MFRKSSFLPRVLLIRAAVALIVLTSLHNIATVRALLNPLFAPPNDNFANAEPLPLGTSGVITGTNVGATKEGSEPNHGATGGGASVWYRWQAPETGRFVFTTAGSSINTLVAVYTGNSFAGPALASNDDDNALLCSFVNRTTSTVGFPAVAGVVYHIAVDSKSGQGSFPLRWGRSATINVRVRTVSDEPGSEGSITLEGGDICRRLPGSSAFTDVPTGLGYSVSVQSVPGLGFKYAPSPENASISPLTGDVTLTYTLREPAYSIFGFASLPGGDVSGLTIMCVSTNGGVISRPADITGSGSFTCPALPVNGVYVVTPSKPGFIFAPLNQTSPSLGGDFQMPPFTGTVAPKRTISGRVTHPNGSGVSGVSVFLSGSQTMSKVTDANGNYSFTDVLHAGNYTVTPSNTNLSFTPASRSFNNLSADQTANFEASFLLQLILDELGQVAAVDSSLLMRDPFPVINNSNLLNTGVDRNTRVTIFLANFQLGPTEPASSVVINLVGSNSQSYDVPAEHVRTWSDPIVAQVTFRLPDTLTAGTCTLVVKARGLTSNMGALRIRN